MRDLRSLPYPREEEELSFQDFDYIRVVLSCRAQSPFGIYPTPRGELIRPLAFPYLLFTVFFKSGDSEAVSKPGEGPSQWQYRSPGVLSPVPLSATLYIALGWRQWFIRNRIFFRFPSSRWCSRLPVPNNTSLGTWLNVPRCQISDLLTRLPARQQADAILFITALPLTFLPHP